MQESKNPSLFNGDWEAEPYAVPPEGDPLVAICIAEVDAANTVHRPTEPDADWSEVDIDLPEAQSDDPPRTDLTADLTDRLRTLLLDGLRDGWLAPGRLAWVAGADLREGEPDAVLFARLLVTARELGIRIDERPDCSWFTDGQYDDDAPFRDLAQDALGFFSDLAAARDDPALHYAREVSRERLLDAAEEIELAQSMEAALNDALKIVSACAEAVAMLRGIAGEFGAAGEAAAPANDSESDCDADDMEATDADSIAPEGDEASGNTDMSRLDSSPSWSTVFPDLPGLQRPFPVLKRLSESLEATGSAPDVHAALQPLLRRAEEARTRQMTANLRLVLAQARRFSHFGLPMSDLIQEGNIGLLRAVDGFEWRRGLRFSIYATLWVRQALARGIDDKARLIRLPVYLAARITSIARCERELGYRNGYPVRSAAIAAELGIPIDKVITARSATPEVLLLDVPDEGGNALRRLVRQVPDPAVRPEELAIRASLSEVLTAALGTLREREQKVLRLRFGLDDDDAHTLEQIGQTMNVTRERIRQIVGKALVRLRRYAPADDLIT